jgi:hypothetical protein
VEIWIRDNIRGQGFSQHTTWRTAIGVQLMTMFGSQWFAAPAAGGFRFFLLDITLNNGSEHCTLDEWILLDADDARIVADMSANDTPSPLVASTNADITTNEPYKVFDRAKQEGFPPGGANQWVRHSATAGFIKIDLGSGNTANLASYQLRRGETAAGAPKNFTVEGSNDGDFTGEETVLDTVTGETSWGTDETRTYTID